MRIIAVQSIVVNAELRNWIFVKVTSDSGLIGWGEATLEWKTRAVTGCIEDLAPLLLGEDPRNITRLHEIMVKHSFWRLGAIGKSAVSGIDIALWDILGQSLGVPVWQLLGGRVRDRVKIYTHLGMGSSDAVYGTTETAPLLDRAAEVVRNGWQALKVVFIPYHNFSVSLAQIDNVADMMSALRECVGDAVDIMVDFHGRPPNGQAALQLIHALEPARPLFVEEPLPPGEIEALAQLRQRVECPIATGERLVAQSEFEPLFHRRAIDIAQPDLCHCGGFTEARRIAESAAIAGIGIAPHNPLGPIAGMAALHLDFAMPNFVIQEKMQAVPWFFTVVPDQPPQEDGFWKIPNKPGLGVAVDEKEAAKHPYQPESVSVIQKARSGEDGTIVNW